MDIHGLGIIDMSKVIDGVRRLTRRSAEGVYLSGDDHDDGDVRYYRDFENVA